MTSGGIICHCEQCGHAHCGHNGETSQSVRHERGSFLRTKSLEGDRAQSSIANSRTCLARYVPGGASIAGPPLSRPDSKQVLSECGACFALTCFASDQESKLWPRSNSNGPESRGLKSTASTTSLRLSSESVFNVPARYCYADASFFLDTRKAAQTSLPAAKWSPPDRDRSDRCWSDWA